MRKLACFKVTINTYRSLLKDPDTFDDLSLIYRKIPIISPGLIFVQKALLLGLFSAELIFGGAYYWKEFCGSKWVGLDNKNSLKHYENNLKQPALEQSMLLYSGGLIIRRIFASEIWAAYFREGLFWGGLIVGILR